jgi:hypothetical protein
LDWIKRGRFSTAEAESYRGGSQASTSRTGGRAIGISIKGREVARLSVIESHRPQAGRQEDESARKLPAFQIVIKMALLRLLAFSLLFAVATPVRDIADDACSSQVKGTALILMCSLVTCMFFFCR